MKNEQKPLGWPVSRVARLLGRDTRTIIRQVQDGAIPSFKAGDTTFVPTWWVEQIEKAAEGVKVERRDNDYQEFRHTLVRRAPRKGGAE